MLSDYNSEQLQNTVTIIREAIKPEKIFLLGAKSSKICTESIFQDRFFSPLSINEYYLLILLKGNDKRPRDEVQDIIEKASSKSTPVVVFVQTTTVFNKWIQNGHSFANNVANNAILLYSSGATKLSMPTVKNSEEIDKVINEESEKSFTRATEFLTGAEFYAADKKFDMAAFSLHQATEHAAIAIVKKLSGFYPSTHNLSKLISYCSPFLGDMDNIFPRTANADKDLFKLLQKAYIHSRYNKQHYYIGEKEVFEIISRVKEFHRRIKEAFLDSSDPLRQMHKILKRNNETAKSLLSDDWCKT